MAKFKYDQIKQFTRAANYSVTVGWNYLEQHIEHQSQTEDGAPLNLEPDFQRAHVWNDLKRARYVEFILRGGTSGRDVYLNCAGWMGDFRGPYVIVDGKQRLEAVRRFLRNELAISIPELSDEPLFMEDFDGNPRMTKCYFTWHVNDLATRAEVLQWYLDLNTGGVVHTQSELERVRRLLKSESSKRQSAHKK